MSNNSEKFPPSIVEINEHNELVINNKMKNMYKNNWTNNKINDDADSLQIDNTIKHYFSSNKIDGSIINILFG